MRFTRKWRKIWATKCVRIRYNCMPCTVLALSLAGRAVLSHATARCPLSTTTAERVLGWAGSACSVMSYFSASYLRSAIAAITY